MRKKIAIMFLFALLLTGCANKGITGNEWILKQPEYLDAVIKYTESLDEVYTLYIIGAITAQDFATEIQTLSQQYEIIQGMYNQAKKENPVLPESHSYVSHLGAESMEKARNSISNILKNSIDTNGNPLPADELAYMYMAYRQEIAGYLAEYATAYQWISDEFDKGGQK